MLSGDKDLENLSPEEKQDLAAEEKMVKDLIGQTFEKFKNVVAEGRKQANKRNELNSDSKGQALSSKWSDYVDGRVLSGKEAYNLGFVDELGGWETAVSRAESSRRDSVCAREHGRWRLSPRKELARPCALV